MSKDALAQSRQRLVVIVAVMLEAIYQPSAIKVLAGLRPRDMRAGGARVPGTSYELPAETAAKTMRELLALRGVQADALVLALAEADIVAREAALFAKPLPTVSGLYPHCAGLDNLANSQTYRAALGRLMDAVESVFTPSQLHRLEDLLMSWAEAPQKLDEMPVQQFVAQFVRNAPP
jgi:hypothetical protein